MHRKVCTVSISFSSDTVGQVGISYDDLPCFWYISLLLYLLGHG